MISQECKKCLSTQSLKKSDAKRKRFVTIKRTGLCLKFCSKIWLLKILDDEVISLCNRWCLRSFERWIITVAFNINLYGSLFPTSFHYWKIWVWVRHDISRLTTSICNSASLVMRHIAKVRKYLDQTNTERLVHTFISFRLDCCNSLLYGYQKERKWNKPQRLQTSAVRQVTRTQRPENISLSPVLQSLHWLPDWSSG